MAITQQDLGDRLSELLVPESMRRVEKLRSAGTRLVHYTSAASAVSIIQSRCIWMRNASCMNDYSEMRFGIDRVSEAYQSDAGLRLRTALDFAHPGFSNSLPGHFDPYLDALANHTYVTCFSEHRDDEDEHGRLSMWRAYGEDAGVALVLNNRPFVGETNSLNAWTIPVSYAGKAGLTELFREMAENLENNVELVRAVPAEDLAKSVALALMFMAVSTKHIGFEEELEWRVVYFPLIHPSERLPVEHVVVRGLPQPVFLLPMKDYPDEGFVGAEPKDIFNRLIIGPTQFPVAVRTSFVQMLSDAGAEDAHSKVICSGVPLRR